jgi:hypothetical protein
MTLSIVHDAAREVDLGYTTNRGMGSLFIYLFPSSSISDLTFSLIRYV